MCFGRSSRDQNDIQQYGGKNRGARHVKVLREENRMIFSGHQMYLFFAEKTMNTTVTLTIKLPIWELRKQTDFDLTSCVYIMLCMEFLEIDQVHHFPPNTCSDQKTHLCHRRNHFFLDHRHLEEFQILISISSCFAFSLSYLVHLSV